MWLKWLVFLLLLSIVFFLFRGLFFLVQKKEGNEKALVHSLAMRVFLCALLVGVLVVGAKMGWIQPHALNQPQ